MQDAANNWKNIVLVIGIETYRRHAIHNFLKIFCELFRSNLRASLRVSTQETKILSEKNRRWEHIFLQQQNNILCFLYWCLINLQSVEKKKEEEERKHPHNSKINKINVRANKNISANNTTSWAGFKFFRNTNLRVNDHEIQVEKRKRKQNNNKITYKKNDYE